MRPAPSRYRRKPSLSRAYPKEKPSPRKTLQYTVVAVFLFVAILFFVSPSVRVVQDLRLFHHTPTHKPPEQQNSTSGDAKWYSDWKWLHPFSASITLDEDRSVLPPLQKRQPIYTFYDADAEKEEKTKDAENKLLLLWRRAWWAQGFKPVILGRAEAMNNPLYESFQGHKLQPQLEANLVRWLAWGEMGTGILANWLVLPMGPYDDYLLSYLRQGEYPKLTRYEGLGVGLYSGEKAAINAAISEALSSSTLEGSQAVLDAVSRSTISVDSRPSAIAFYDANANAEHYKSITAKLAEDKAAGLGSLAQLINSHLHLTFLNTFTAGLAILTPYADRSHILTQHAVSLAETLRKCPSSPIPSSCPPNHQECTPCSSIPPSPIMKPEYFTNSSTVYTIGIIPHPYTFASLLGNTKDITTRHIRRDTERDRWLGAVTEKTLGREIGGQSRIVSFKETVAGDWGRSRGLWMTEDPAPDHKDMEYHFGFELAPFNITNADSETTFGSKKEQKTIQQMQQQQEFLLTNAKDVLRQRKGKHEKTGVKEMVEAWNLADTEAWRFVRAYGARERVERTKWEEEERAFAGGEEGREEGWGRWFDR
ncbi:hypothetical protein MMC28_003894 [Mycoblastus sanguinarius]|nr:hypothetical protein [Mycoblastus sanguinarius]